jgi:gliding motility-associated lipoprotein GldD
MKKVVLVLVFIFISISVYLYFQKEEYYIPKPKAMLKMDLPDNNFSIFSDDKIHFNVSNSAIVNQSDISYSILYHDYESKIYFSVKNLDNLDLEIYNFENSISVHEKQGAYIDANIIEDSTENIYGVLCYLEGSNIATSSQFFITDSIQYFVRGGLEFSTSINPEIEVQNDIMKQEVFKFIQSFKWSDK